jgi:hypothetical protein
VQTGLGGEIGLDIPTSLLEAVIGTNRLWASSCLWTMLAKSIADQHDYTKEACRGDLRTTCRAFVPHAKRTHRHIDPKRK